MTSSWNYCGMSILIWIGPNRTLNPIIEYLVFICVFFGYFVSFSSGSFVSELEKFNTDKIKYDGLPEVVANLAGIGHSELSVVSDFAAPSSIQEHFFNTLNEHKVSYATYNVEELRRKRLEKIEHPEACPMFQEPHHADHGDGHSDEGHGDGHGDANSDGDHGNDHGGGHSEEGHENDHGESHSDGHHGDDHHDGHSSHDKHDEKHGDKKGHHDGHEVETFMVPDSSIYVRPAFIPNQRFYNTFFIWVSDSIVSEVMEIFDETILHCDQYEDYGIYHPNHRFLFFIDPTANKSEQEIFDSIFEGSQYPSKHRHLAVLFRLPPKSDEFGIEAPAKYKIFTYDFFASDSEGDKMRLAGIWVENAENNKLSTIEQFYGNNLKDFMGYHFRVATNPWSHHVQAASLPENVATPQFKYTDYYGFEINILVELARVLNFTYTIENPPDGKWGHVEADGTWSGLVRHAKDGIVDFVICDVFLTYSRSQVYDGGLPFDTDFMEFAAPKPLPVARFLSLIYPLDYFVWLLVLISYIAAGVVFWIISTVEGKLTNNNFREWSESKNAFWYSYGTLLGESITRDTNSSKAPGLRVIIAVWILYCLVIGSSYTGNLRAFLITPTFTKPIQTLKEVVESGLEWGMVMYGEEEERMMAQSTDPVISAIWKYKVEEPYRPNPPLGPVYEGKKVFIDWKSGIGPAIYKEYQLPSGEKLVYESPNPVFMPNYPGYAYDNINPWRPRHDQVIRRILEAGLVETWKKRTWIRMKREYQEELKRTGKEGIKFDIKPLISAITLDDFQGVFYLGGLMLGCSLIVFLTEIIWLECCNILRENQDGKTKTMAWQDVAALVDKDQGPKSISQIIHRSKHVGNINEHKLRENRGTANVI